MFYDNLIRCQLLHSKETYHNLSSCQLLHSKETYDNFRSCLLLHSKDTCDNFDFQPNGGHVYFDHLPAEMFFVCFWRCLCIHLMYGDGVLNFIAWLMSPVLGAAL
jgi:hypothetical protein